MQLANYQHKSLKEIVYSSIKDNIIYRNNIEPGDKINITKISENYNISLTPIREALKHLEGEDLIINKKGKGYYVISLSKEDIYHLYEIRCSLEKLAVKQSFDNLVNEDVKEMEKINALIKKDEKFDFKKQTELNEKFHNIFINKSKNIWLKKEIDHFNDLFIFARGNDKDTPLDDAYFHHEQIISAIKNNDKQKAIKKMEEHIFISRKRIMDKLS